MGVNITEAEVSFERRVEEPSRWVEIGETPNYPVMSVFTRPIRPNLTKLLKAGFKEDKSSYDILSIGQVIISQAEVSFESPNGVFGVWGAAQKYDQTKLDGAVVFSYDNFETIARSVAIDNIEYKAGSGIDPAVIKGEDDEKAGTGVRTNSVKIQPASGLPYKETDMPAGTFSERNVQMGRLVIKVRDVKGKPVVKDYVKYEATGDFYITDVAGKVTLDAPAGSLKFTGLRGAKTKTVDVEAFTEKEMIFQYAGIEGVVVDAFNTPIPGTVVDIQEVDGEDHFAIYTDGSGKYFFELLKPETTYKVTILNFWKEFPGMAEGALIIGNFNNAQGWNVPPGYPTEVTSAALVIKDEKGFPLYDILVTIYDEIYNWVAKTNLSGNVCIVVPKKKYRLLSDGGNRYVSIDKEVDLTEKYSETIILARKVAISIR